MRSWLILAGVILASAIAVRALTRPRALPPPTTLRLVDRLADARRVIQDITRIEPETLYLKRGVVKPPEGWREVECPHAACFVSDGERPFAARIEVPLEGLGGGGRDYVIRAFAVDPEARLRMRVMHAPDPDNPDQPDLGWHRATVERGDRGRVRFDWREDTRAGQTTLPIAIESDAAREVIIERLSVREAGARDPAILESAPAAALHGIVERPVEGASAISRRGARRALQALLASDGGVYEWALPGPGLLDFSTAIVPRGPGGGAPIEMIVELQNASGWTRAFSAVRGAGDDAGLWREARVEIPREARAIRLATRATAPGRPQVVAWGNPVFHPKQAKATHVVLLTLDAVRPDHLSMYGYARKTSPFLDGLAARGARFEDVTAQRGHTWASITSLLTGLMPQTSGVTQRGARPLRGVRSLADAFAEAGFTTARVGSPDLPRGQLSGFDVTEIADFDLDVVERMKVLARSLGDRPLFLWVHVSTAHYPWTVADKFNVFDREYRGPFASSISRAEFRALQDLEKIPEPVRAHLTALYDGAILQMDQRLGAALAELDDQGFFADAILAVTADHGAHFGEHDIWFMHSTPWRAGLQVPLVIYAPGRISPSVIARDRGRALLVDVAPTLLGLAGISPEGLDGVSLLPALSGARLPERATVTRYDPAGYVTVEDSRWKLLWNPRREALEWPGESARKRPLREVALFDRAADPDEKNDVSAQHPEVVKALSEKAEADLKTRARAAMPLSTEARRLLEQAGYAGDEY